jgi:hypothetical protein
MLRPARDAVSSFYCVFPVGKRASRPGPDGSRARQDKGFMSTQRRENLWQNESCAERGIGLGQIWFAFLAWFVRAIARVGTAPQKAIISLPSEWLATNSLPLGHCTTQPVRQEICRTSHSSPPIRAARCGSDGTPATRRSSLPLTPAPSVLERLHPSLPQTPAGQCRRTERYDGKRDLHFLNAA